MTVPIRFVLLVVGSAAYLALAVLGWGGFGAFSPVRPWSLSQWYSPLWSVWRSLPWKLEPGQARGSWQSLGSLCGWSDQVT
jgi:hypothetical protein